MVNRWDERFMKTYFLPFTSDMIPEAASLLAARHARNRTKFPLLPTRFEDPHTAGKAIETLSKESFSGGYTAFQNGKMFTSLVSGMTIQPWDRI